MDITVLEFQRHGDLSTYYEKPNRRSEKIKKILKRQKATFIETYGPVSMINPEFCKKHNHREDIFATRFIGETK